MSNLKHSDGEELRGKFTSLESLKMDKSKESFELNK